MDYNVKLFDRVILSKGFEAQDEGRYICILFDLMLYRHSALTKSVFELMCIYFLRTRTIINNIENVQVLENSKSIHTLNVIKDYTNSLKKLQAETSFWLTKPNEYGNKRKDEAAKIF